MPTISLPSSEFFMVGPFTITNSVITTLTVSLILIVLAFLIKRKAGVIPSRSQVIFESLLNFILDKMIMAFGSRERALKFFPLYFTIFLFLLIGNQFMLIPFAESIVTEDGVNLFRSPASDYSLPIVFTLFILILSHILALAIRPIKHIGSFIKIEQFFKIKSIKDLPMAFLDFFLGLLDIIGEFAKLASLSTRLFGNMFAGSIIVGIIASLTTFTQFLVPIPFIALGILSGVVQAFVFVMLGSLYISAPLNAVKPVEETN